ncbi:MAG TPA: Kazal-type serine protease inhibitor family protein [Stellaceae bacterium]|jgi:hypothetical protein|nr:Kazal-type serine protease inhibitor family protein [Stellaceae bacterium]
MHLKSRSIWLAAAASLLVFASSGDASAAQRCGGLRGARCGPGQYCQVTPRMCHVRRAIGVCAIRPRICPRIFRPVCGCNGRTFANSCEAAAAGVSVLHPGKCG